MRTSPKKRNLRSRIAFPAAILTRSYFSEELSPFFKLLSISDLFLFKIHLDSIWIQSRGGMSRGGRTLCSGVLCIIRCRWWVMLCSMDPNKEG